MNQLETVELTAEQQQREEAQTKEISDASVEKYGILYPALLDSREDIKDKVIDGVHRTKVAERMGKEMPKPITVHIEKEQDRLYVRVISNKMRRDIPASEMGELFNKIARLEKADGSITERFGFHIGKKLGFSEQYVLRFLSDEFKDQHAATAGRGNTLGIPDEPDGMEEPKGKAKSGNKAPKPHDFPARDTVAMEFYARFTEMGFNTTDIKKLTKLINDLAKANTKIPANMDFTYVKPIKGKVANLMAVTPPYKANKKNQKAAKNMKNDPQTNRRTPETPTVTTPAGVETPVGQNGKDVFNEKGNLDHGNKAMPIGKGYIDSPGVVHGDWA